MIRDRERLRGTGIELLPSEFLPHGEQSRLAERAVDVHRPRHLGDSVLGQRYHRRTRSARGLDQLPAQRVHRRDLCGYRRVGGPETLQVVVEMRQVDERQRRALALEHAALRAIHCVDSMPAAGPQNLNSGKGPSSRCSSSRRPAGCV